MRRSPLSSLALALALALGGVRSASASENYRGVLERDFGWTGTCNVCHLGPEGMAGTARQPFSVALLGAGVGFTAVLSDDDVRAALLAFAAQNPDTDMDGYPDFDEIAQMGDPNDPEVGPGEANFLVPEYGCLSIVGPPARRYGLGFGVWLCALLVARRRLRRKG